MKTKATLSSETERLCSAPLVSRRFRRIKLSRAISAKAFAERVKVGRNIMSQIEGGLYVPTPRIVARVIDQFGVDWNYVYGGSTEMLPTKIAEMLESVTEEMIDDDISANAARRGKRQPPTKALVTRAPAKKVAGKKTPRSKKKR